jgi:hypothetical protein
VTSATVRAICWRSFLTGAHASRREQVRGDACNTNFPFAEKGAVCNRRVQPTAAMSIPYGGSVPPAGEPFPPLVTPLSLACHVTAAAAAVGHGRIWKRYVCAGVSVTWGRCVWRTHTRLIHHHNPCPPPPFIGTHSHSFLCMPSFRSAHLPCAPCACLASPEPLVEKRGVRSCPLQETNCAHSLAVTTLRCVTKRAPSLRTTQGRLQGNTVLRL